jgi:DNA-binding IclR family transcriptional regulator
LTLSDIAGIAAMPARACHLHRPGFARRLECRADRTVTDPVKLRQLIEDCQRTGYSAIEDELAYGVVALAGIRSTRPRGRGAQ